MDTTISEQLRGAIRASGKTSYEIAKECGGLSPSVLTRFLRSERSLTLTVVDRVAAVLGLGLRPVLSPRVNPHDGDPNIYKHGF